MATALAKTTIVRYNFLRLLAIETDTVMALDVNDKAPAFTIPNQDGELVSLKDFVAKNLVLFFYPKADTPG